MDMNAIIKLALDLTKGVQSFSYAGKEYSASEASEVLRQALKDANGGSSKIDYKSMRRNKVEVFEIIEELVPAIINEGLQGNEFWTSYVDERNLALGDQNDFVVPDNHTFVVTEIADGIATPRRQRIGKSTTMTITPTIHAIRMYEEFGRFMAGRIDWNELCNKVANAFQQAIWSDIYTAFNGITSSTTGMNSTYVKTGVWDEDTMLTLISHVEAATGEVASIVGTKAALRKVTSSVLSNEARDNSFNYGFYGKFYGTPEVAVPQVHSVGTDTFVLSDSDIYIIAGDQKFIHFVNEGNATIVEKDGTVNADLTVEYLTIMKWGVGVCFAEKSFGKYTIS